MKISSLKAPRALLIALVIIGLIPLAYALLRSVLLHEPQNWSNTLAVTLTLTLLLSAGNLWLMERMEKRGKQQRFWRDTLIEVAVVLAFTMAVVVSVTLVYASVGLAQGPSDGVQLYNNLIISVVISVVMLAFFKGSRYFVRWKKEMITAEELKRQNLVSRFETLRNQVNPHFLFNSFNTLSALIDEDKELSQHYLRRLSDYFRQVLEYRETTSISLKEELNLVRTYFELQESRFGNSLLLKLQLSEQVLNCRIPPMTIQMLAENAIKHNIISKDMPLIVSIKDSAGFIEVSNTLRLKRVKEYSSGVGLNNIRNRYLLLAGVSPIIEQTDNLFTVKLPLIFTDDKGITY